MEDNQEPESTNQPEATPTINPFEEASPKQSKKKLLLILIPLIILLIGGAAAAYILWPKASDGDLKVNTPNQTEENQPESNDLAGSLIEKIQSTVAADLKSEYPTYTESKEDNSSPAYLVDGYDYRFAGAFGHGISFMLASSSAASDTDFEFTDKVNDVAKTIFTAADLKLTNTAKDQEEEYQSDEVVCTIALKSVPAYIRCANIADYEKDVATTKPFADAYFASDPSITDKSLVVLRTPEIKESKNPGYKTAVVSIGGYMSPGGAAGLFYSVNDQWKFFTATQSSIPCDGFDTPELRLAYEGEACYDLETQTSSTVQKP